MDVLVVDLWDSFKKIRGTDAFCKLIFLEFFVSCTFLWVMSTYGKLLTFKVFTLKEWGTLSKLKQLQLSRKNLSEF